MQAKTIDTEHLPKIEHINYGQMAEKKLSVNLPIVRNPYLNLETNN